MKTEPIYQTFRFEKRDQYSDLEKIIKDAILALPDSGSSTCRYEQERVVECMAARRALLELVKEQEAACARSMEDLRQAIAKDWKKSEIPEETKAVLNSI